MLLICVALFLCMFGPPPRSTPTDTLLPYTTLFLSIATGLVEPFYRPGRHQRSITSRSTGSNLPAISPFSLARNAPIAPPSPTISQIAPSDSALARSEEHTSELQSLMRLSYAVFCLKKKQTPNNTHHTHQ